MKIADARIRYSQFRPLRATDPRFIVPKQQQSRAKCLAIHRQQACSLRSPYQHLRLLPRGPLNPAAI